MKKYYLILMTVGALQTVLAQKTVNTPPPILAGVSAIAGSGISTTDIASNGGFSSNATKHKVVSRGTLNTANFIEIGGTYYDLQSNGAMPHRMVLASDGSVSATWTTAAVSATDFPSRGAGYAFRSSAGAWSAKDNTRCETVRTGWANIGLLSNGNPFVIGHDAANGGFFISKGSGPGVKPSGAVKILSEVPLKPIWGRVANSGDTIHFIYTYSDSTVAGDIRAPKRKGITAPMVYSRSLDGGVTWDKQHIMLPGYDSTILTYGGADAYAIDCRGKNVAIITGGALESITAWKSTDFGTTFKKVAVDSFKYGVLKTKQVMKNDTPMVNDGTMDVILDKNNKMHVFWGMNFVYTHLADSATYFSPGAAGIVYWNEITKTRKVIATGKEFDYNGNGVLNATAETESVLLTGGAVPSGVSTVARLGSSCLMRQPNASIDPNGNIYCIFSVPIEFDISDLNANFRDIGVVASKDGGVTWGSSQNITQTVMKEDDFANTARAANGFLHVAWQRDDIPGTNLQNNSSSVGNHPVVLNSIMYQAIPVSEILNGTIGMLSSVDKPQTGKVMIVNQNYPNPFSGTTNVLVYLTNPGDLNVSVHNMAGAEVRTQKLDGLMRGNHIVQIDAEGLPAGIYTYSLTAGGSTASKTMIVR